MPRERICKIISPFFLLLVWYAVAALIAAPLILPYPHTVLIRLFQLARTWLFWKAFAFTFLRVIISFLISLLAGFFLGLLAADSKVFAAFIEFPLELIRATPVIAVILPALFWFTSGVVPVFVAVLMCLPLVITASQKGFSHSPENIEKLFKANSRGFTGLQAFLHIRLPAAAPALASGADSAFGLAWKVVAAGEVLSIPRHAAGSLMQLAQVHLESADVLAVTGALIIFSYLLEKIMHIWKNNT
jgi:NitT/TauT family transport system permease protein